MKYHFLPQSSQRRRRERRERSNLFFYVTMFYYDTLPDCLLVCDKSDKRLADRYALKFLFIRF